ncbi:LuxR C-terminal-related transcriptional regulator [Streptomyces sp. NPDC059009]|uniref:LuxR C-terminal-related transcriptional regulator n=1 Tax=Streptomyces sp. NPDC059009 TaxID=3346694 RepID=UPI00368955E7
MPAVVCTRTIHRSGADGHLSVLHERLRSLNSGADAADATMTTCLMWVAGALVRIAGDVADPRCAGALVDEAAAVLASVPANGDRAPRPAHPAPTLTNRQLVVLRRLQASVPLRQIASELYISHNTVKSHVRAVYRKLGASSRDEAVRHARELDLL